MPLSRRHFVHRSAAAALFGALPGQRAWTFPGTLRQRARIDTQARLVDPAAMLALARRAVEAAQAAGATYADARLTRTVEQWFGSNEEDVVGDDVNDYEQFAVGVRALVNGTWGFAASPYWTPDEMTQLAQRAVAQAKASARGSRRHVELPPIPAATGAWTMPGIDPFSISIDEKIDFINGWRQATNDFPPGIYHLNPSITNLQFRRQEHAVASTAGTGITQTTYVAGGSFRIHIDGTTPGTGLEGTSIEAVGVKPQGGGWDVLLDANLKAQYPALLERAAEISTLRTRPVEIGRYDVVFDAAAVASLVNATFGVATQLDRALGHEANAGGTSYLGPDPLALLGTCQVGAPLLTVTANRSLPRGLATVKWDDEGVEPADFTLVKDGMLTDYQTTREQAAWLAPWYQKQGLPLHSHGCAAAPSALEFTMQHTPNLSLVPGTAATSVADLIADTSQGVAIVGSEFEEIEVNMDVQAKNGWCRGFVREIKNGKLGPRLKASGVSFNTPDLWKNLVALGGPGSVAYVPGVNNKGQPNQTTWHTVAAVPAKFTKVAVIDILRRA